MMGSADTGKRYSPEEQTEFVELAQEVGVARAIRELGYPTFTAAIRWMKQRGIEPPKSSIMETARLYSQFYQTEDMLAAVDNGMSVIEELFTQVVSADDAKKLSEAIQKLANTRLLLEGKANSIVESNNNVNNVVDPELLSLINAERARQDIA